MRSLRRCLSVALIATLVCAGLAASATAQPVQVPAKGQSRTVDKIKEAGRLRAGVAIALPWLGQDPKTGQYFGASYDVGAKIAQTLGVKLEIVPSGWDVLVAGLQARQFELAIAPLFATEKRKAVIDFATYTEAGTCYMVLKTNAKVNTLADLNKPEVVTGTFTGTGTEQEFVKKYPKAKINSVVQAPGGATRVVEVLTGRIDAAPFDSPLALALASKYPQIKIIPEPNACIRKPDIPIPIGVGYSKGDAAWARFVTAVIESMRPQLTDTIAKYSTLEFLQDQLGN